MSSRLSDCQTASLKSKQWNLMIFVFARKQSFFLFMYSSYAIILLSFKDWNPQSNNYMYFFFAGYVSRSNRRQHELNEVAKQLETAKKPKEAQKPLVYLEKIEKPVPRPLTPSVEILSQVF